MECIFEFLFNAFWKIQYRHNVSAVGLRFYNVGTNCFSFIQLLNSQSIVYSTCNQRTLSVLLFSDVQGVTITLMLTGLFGIDMWKINWPLGMSTATLFEIILYASGLLSSHPYIVYRIVMSYRKRTGKMRPFIEAIRPLIPFVSMFAITSVWVLHSHNNICYLEPRMLFLLFGTVFSNISVSLLLLFMHSIAIRIVTWIKYTTLFHFSFNSVVWLLHRCLTPERMLGIICCGQYYLQCSRQCYHGM